MSEFSYDFPHPAFSAGNRGAGSDWAEPPAVSKPPPANVFTAAAWGEFLYVLLGLATSILFFVLTITLIAVGAGLAIIYVGVPLLALGLLVARAGAYLAAGLGRVLLGWPIQPQRPIAIRRAGPIGAMTAVVRDGTSWRSVAFHVLRILIAPVAFAFSLAFYASGLGSLSYWFWQHWLPYQSAPDGTRHRGAQLWPGFFLDTWPRMLVLIGVGGILLALAPRVTRFFTNLDRALLAGLVAGR